MNVYLLLIDDARYFFYSADEEEDEEEGSSSRGAVDGSGGSWTSRLTARAVAKLQQFKGAWQHAETGMLGRAHHWWDWLHTFIHPQEAMLVQLYWAKRIELFYPASRSDEIRAIWQSYLRGRFWHHVLWLGINAVIAIPTMCFLWLLPGPNFIGYWFAYRAIHHGLIVLGIRRARRETVPTALIASEALDRPVHRDTNGKVEHPIFRGARNHHRLHVYYEWAGGRRPPPSSAQVAASPDGLNSHPNGQGDGSTAHESSQL